MGNTGAHWETTEGQHRYTELLYYKDTLNPPPGSDGGPWLPCGNWIHSSSWALRKASVRLFCILWVTLPAPPGLGLWYHLDGLHLCLFPLSAVTNQKPVSSLYSVHSQQCGYQPKQTGSKFANLFSFDELRRVFHSRLNTCSERGLFMADALVLRIPTTEAKQQHPKWSHYGHLPLAETSPAASQPPLEASTLGNTSTLPGCGSTPGKRDSGIAVSKRNRPVI